MYHANFQNKPKLLTTDVGLYIHIWYVPYSDAIARFEDRRLKRTVFIKPIEIVYNGGTFTSFSILTLHWRKLDREGCRTGECFQEEVTICLYNCCFTLLICLKALEVTQVHELWLTKCISKSSKASTVNKLEQAYTVSKERSYITSGSLSKMRNRCLGENIALTRPILALLI